MSSDYECLFHANFDDDQDEDYRISEILRRALPGWAEEASYSRRVELLSRLVIPEDREQFLHDADPAVAAEKLRGGNPYIFYSRAKVGSRVQWYQMKYVHHTAHGDRNCALIGIANYDDNMHKSMRERAVIDALGEDFSFISYIDPHTMEETVYRSSASIETYVPEWGKVFGYTERIGLIAQKMVHPEDRALFAREASLEQLARDLLKKPLKYLNFRAQLGERTIYFQGKFVLIEIDGMKNVVVGFKSVDEATREHLAYQQELDEARARAEAANEAKTTFLFNMSHDIRTPMNAVIGFTDIAKKHIDDRERVITCLDKVKMSSEHLLSLINDVLDMSRVESGKVTIDEQPLCIDAVYDNLLSIVAGSAAEKNISIAADADPSLVHHWVYADGLRTMRVLTNIVSNSIKYTEPGGNIRIQVGELPSESEDRVRIRVTIADTGIGMSPEFLEHIFEPFARAESSTKSGVQGTGLGMAITKSLVELMGGTISVESEPDVGTTVTTEFPFRIAEPFSDDEADRAKDIAASGILRGRKVLLVEDNALNREIATEILEEEGIAVSTAEDGDIAVRMMEQAAPGQYDLILMDIQMPTMNGYDATRAIRRLPDRAVAEIPIVAMTANAFDEDKRTAMEAGMNGHIAKPVSISMLLQTLTEILHQGEEG